MTVKEKIKLWAKGRLFELMNGMSEKNAESVLTDILSFVDSLQEEPSPYILYASRESAIKAHAEDYSWNIESELFQQLTPEQQKLWRKEIEQACISGGYSGLNLAKDPRYENLEAREAMEIARGEIYEWLKEHSQEYVYWMDEEFGKDDLINDLKQAMKDE